MFSLSELYEIFLKSDGVSRDTRGIRPNSLFFALVGEHFNGNQFVKEALNNGASLVVASDISLKGTDDRIMVVDDTLDTLQKLALHHRQQFKIPVIAITGTNGKTTTKELVSSVLLEKYRIVRTEGNLNNHIGVPLTLLRIKESTEIAIIEMGANHINDIRNLCIIAEPTHGLITNIGTAHLEGFGSKEGVAKAKGALYEWLRDHSGTIFINNDDSDLTSLLYSIDPGCKAKTIRYGNERVPKNDKLFGEYNIVNMRSAFAIGTYFDVLKSLINKTLKEYTPSNMRGQIIHTKKNNDVILDAYNANPSSMKAALESFSKYKTTRPKWLILGDMKELGEMSFGEHCSTLNDISFYCFSNVILIGKSFSEAHDSNDIRRYACFKTKKEFLLSAFAKSIKGSAVLIKGSNSMALWELVDVL